jgi:hypothetical protein
MIQDRSQQFRLSDTDLDFLIETVSSQVTDKLRLKQIIREDEDFRNRFISDEIVFRRVMDDDEIFLRISPTLFFEILLRRAAGALEQKSFTLEQTRTMKIPVFDSGDVVDLLNNDDLLVYLADMLSSFTRIESYTIAFRTKPGVWRKIRFNDLDIHSLMAFAQVVDVPHRLSFFKRIGDICLFILGIFPEHAEYDYRYPFSKQQRPHIRGKMRISPEAYIAEGQKFYRLAAEHPSAEELQMADIFRTLHENFQKVKKSLNFISDHFLQYKKSRVFG